VLKNSIPEFGDSELLTANSRKISGFFTTISLPIIYTQGSLGASGDLAPPLFVIYSYRGGCLFEGHNKCILVQF
jgi:hypothetical protein